MEDIYILLGGVQPPRLLHYSFMESHITNKNTNIVLLLKQFG